MAADKTERFELRIETDLLSEIDAWRGGQSDLPTRAEAIRRLIREGVQNDIEEARNPTSDKLFQMMKFQILSPSPMLDAWTTHPEAYRYAWRNGIYPFFHDGDDWHKPFALHFDVSEDMMDSLSRYFEECDESKNVPTFYALEARYRVRDRSSEWSRASLIAACRYMVLDERFGTSFWRKILRGSEHPVEAKSILRDN